MENEQINEKETKEEEFDIDNTFYHITNAGLEFLQTNF